MTQQNVAAILMPGMTISVKVVELELGNARACGYNADYIQAIELILKSLRVAKGRVKRGESWKQTSNIM
jgi:hypothetical protein